MKLSNDMEKYEIEVTKVGQNYSRYLVNSSNRDHRESRSKSFIRQKQ